MSDSALPHALTFLIGCGNILVMVLRIYESKYANSVPRRVSAEYHDGFHEFYGEEYWRYSEKSLSECRER